MVGPARYRYRRICFFLLAAFPAVLALTPCLFQVRAQQQPSHEQHQHVGHEGMNMPMDEPTDPAAQARLQAKTLADKKESEFNHHLAGVLVAIAGIFMLLTVVLVHLAFFRLRPTDDEVIKEAVRHNGTGRGLSDDCLGQVRSPGTFISTHQSTNAIGVRGPGVP